jgi:hypothetical protein
LGFKEIKSNFSEKIPEHLSSKKKKLQMVSAVKRIMTAGDRCQRRIWYSLLAEL